MVAVRAGQPGGVSWLLAGQPAQRVQQGAELISAGQHDAVAVRGPQAGVRAMAASLGPGYGCGGWFQDRRPGCNLYT